jgi:hypothetical protein
MYCHCCGNTDLQPGWHLQNYYGLSGNFCHACYKLIAHDSLGEPKDPKGYLMMRLRLAGVDTAQA